MLKYVEELRTLLSNILAELKKINEKLGDK